MARLALIALVALLATPCSAAQEESTHIDGIEVVIWTPSVDVHHPWPVVVFSHGLYTCATQSRFITRAIADAGYFVVAPNHKDATCALGVGAVGFSRLPGKLPILWTDADYRDRADDIRRLVAALPNDRRFAGRIDVRRLALSGHSLGGYTVLGLAGAWASWSLPGVKAVLAFAPYTMPFRRGGGIRHLTAPVMYQSGGFDPAFSGPLKRAFDDSPSPKYYVEIEHAWHLAWTDIGRMHRDQILANAIAFLDMYVKAALPPDATAQATATHDLSVTP